jgi:hypothetical protein
MGIDVDPCFRASRFKRSGINLPRKVVAMSKDLKPLAPIAIRFQHDLKIKGKGERTQQSYLRMFRKFSEFLGADPDSASEEDLRRYLLHISENQLWKPSTINVAYQALKQFFRRTCPRDWKTLQFVRVQVEQKIPTVPPCPKCIRSSNWLMNLPCTASSPSSMPWDSGYKKPST